MHFTREPIIESVITARDGYKLTVRSTKRGADHEEYTVEAVEIVSFGKAQFFRSLEKPKPFLLPVSDFEVLETKETRVLLKGVSLEKSIKIGGGREAPMRAQKEQSSEREAERSSGEEEPNQENTATSETRRKDRKRHRRRRANEERSEMKEWSDKKKAEGQQATFTEEKLSPTGELPPVTSPLLGTLIPPPTTLISESLARYKETLILESPVHDDHVNEPPKEKGRPEEEASSVPHVYPVHSEGDDTFLP